VLRYWNYGTFVKITHMLRCGAQSSAHHCEVVYEGIA